MDLKRGDKHVALSKSSTSHKYKIYNVKNIIKEYKKFVPKQ